MLLRLRSALCTAALLLAGSACAHAQFAIYAMGSGGFLGAPNAAPGSLLVDSGSISAYGGTFGLYDDFAHLGPVHLGADARYFQQSSSNGGPGNKLRGGLAGLRLDLHLPLVPFRPYVQAEAGGVGTNYGRNANVTSSFAYQIQGGLDFTIFPHLDLRAEYGGGRISGFYDGTKQTLQQVGLGAVLRF